MSILNGLGPNSPLLPMSPLVRAQSFDWDSIIRSQSAAAAALENPGLQLLGDHAAAGQEQSLAVQSVPQFPNAQQTDDVAPMAQGDDSPQEVKEEQVDRTEAIEKRTRKKRKTATPPSEDGSEPLTKLERNRLAAQKSRKKKQLYVKKLEDKNSSLEQIVKQLSQALVVAQGKVVKLTQQVENLKQELEQRQ